MPLTMLESDAHITSDGRYRYWLKRRWHTDPMVCWVCLNPSTADHRKDDNTIRRIAGFTKAWGYGGFWVVNLFALRSTDPGLLYTDRDPVGRGNDLAIQSCATQADRVVCAWGTAGAFMDRGKSVLEMLARHDPQCFGLTKCGNPKHPLYLSAKSKLEPFAQAVEAKE